MKTLLELEQKARAAWERVKSHPLNRFALRKLFYKKYGFGGLLDFGFGNSEISFLNWEIRRGVLDMNTGSTWWRGVNETLALESGLASAIFEEKATFEGLPAPVRFWLEYLEKPSAHNWYKAHNASIVSGYEKYLHALEEENEAERIFVNRVLYLVLFAAWLNDEKNYSMSQMLLNPRLFSVSVALLSYPDRYPIQKHEGLQSFWIDRFTVFPRLASFYEHASQFLEMPVLHKWHIDGKPCYGISPDVWKSI